MTCTYYDKANNEMLVEAIPEVSGHNDKYDIEIE
jgi:hypothetical protein